MNMLVKNIVVKSNVRQDLGDLSTLTESVKLQGILEPLVVRKVGKDIVLLAGHRRLAAAKAAGLTEVPTHLIEVDEADVEALQLAENLHRKDLSPFEVIEAIGQELNRRGWKFSLDEQALPSGLDEICEDIARKVGHKVRYIKQMARLAFLPKWAKDMLAKDNLTIEQALMVSQLPPEAQKRMQSNFYDLHRIQKPGDKIPTSAFAHFIERFFGKDLSKAPFPLDEPINGLPCIGCSYNTSNTPELFDTGNKAGICRKLDCYRSKCQAVSTETKKKHQAKEPLPFIGYSSYGFSGQEPDTIKGLKVVSPDKKKLAADLKAIAEKGEAKHYGLAVLRAAQGKKPKVVYVSIKGTAEDDAKQANQRSRQDYARESFVNNFVREALAGKYHEAMAKWSTKEWLDFIVEYATKSWETKHILDGEKITEITKDSAVKILGFRIYEDVSVTPKFFGIDEKAFMKEQKAKAEEAWKEKQKTPPPAAEDVGGSPEEDEGMYQDEEA